MVEIKATNGISFGYTFDVDSTSNVEVAFVGNSGEVLKDLAIVASNATFTVDATTGVVTVTPTANGRVDLIAQKAYPHA